MDRRYFVKTALAAGVASSLPILGGCGEKARVATEAETGIAAISLDGAETELSKAAIRELGEAMAQQQGQPGQQEAGGSTARIAHEQTGRGPVPQQETGVCRRQHPGDVAAGGRQPAGSVRPAAMSRSRAPPAGCRCAAAR